MKRRERREEIVTNKLNVDKRKGKGKYKGNIVENRLWREKEK